MSDGSSAPDSARSRVGSEPAGDDHDQLLDHEYDGIREYDNPLPRWWVWMFAGSFWFSVAYFFQYHLSGNGESVAAAYDAEVADAREQQAKTTLAEPVSEESLSKLMADEALMTDTNALFALRCAPCHGDRGQGVIGPNLTDSAWLHGSRLSDIFVVINEGVLAKGMPAWGKQLSPIEVRKLAAFVGTQRGKAIPGKAPEGIVATAP
ncbi:MAG: Cbb3-type cytochrome c oxidase subunit CcoP2 [Polyangiaceae bacterium]|nr:Cbb3-type cytochrome c oxidase subunit CcoP2 [Polyangiaceae bacterium]